jgi:hypothetical protein
MMYVGVIDTAATRVTDRGMAQSDVVCRTLSIMDVQDYSGEIPQSALDALTDLTTQLHATIIKERTSLNALGNSINAKNISPASASAKMTVSSTDNYDHELIMNGCCGMDVTLMHHLSLCDEYLGKCLLRRQYAARRAQLSMKATPPPLSSVPSSSISVVNEKKYVSGHSLEWRAMAAYRGHAAAMLGMSRIFSNRMPRQNEHEEDICQSVRWQLMSAVMDHVPSCRSLAGVRLSSPARSHIVKEWQYKGIRDGKDWDQHGKTLDENKELILLETLMLLR